MKKSKLTLDKFRIAKLSNPSSIFGGTATNSTDPNDPRCDDTEDTTGATTNIDPTGTTSATTLGTGTLPTDNQPPSEDPACTG